MESGSRLAFVLLATLTLCLSEQTAHAQLRRINLELLVVSADDVGTEMVKAGLDEGLVPYTEVNLMASGRPKITDAFLVEQSSSSVRRAKFQAVVLPNEAPAGLSADERSALVRFEREFKIRQLDAYTYPSAAVGLTSPKMAGYEGSLDGTTGRLTSTALANGFAYLVGNVPFEDLDLKVREIHGYVALPLALGNDPKRSFTPFIQQPIPGRSELGSVLGVYRDDGREELVLMVALNQHQVTQQLLFPGILSWLTYGVHLGTERNYLAVHIDDVFLADGRWNYDRNCTAGADCPSDVAVRDILMKPEDVDFLLAWQTRQGLKLDMVFNGYGYDVRMEEKGAYPLGDKLLRHKDQLRWINHTYSHLYLGCVQDFSVVPWRCARDGAGRVQWTPYDVVYSELRKNLDFAERMEIDFDRAELVTGEHSGLQRAPEEPSDNPNLVRALNDLGVRWLGSDNSREKGQRQLGSALTVPRYPLNIFYNAGTSRELIDEYNWVYTPLARGGSGICETDPTSTCIEPLNPATSFTTYLVPNQARQAMLHALSNSPRPHYVHQSNLTEDRVLYPVLDQMLADYRKVFASNAPLANPTLAELGSEFRNRAAWAKNRGQVSGYVQGDTLVLSNASGVVQVPVTAPEGSLGGSFSRYGDLHTGWLGVRSGTSSQFSLPSSVGYAH